GSSEPGAAATVGPAANTVNRAVSNSPTLALPETGSKKRGRGGDCGGGGSPTVKLMNDPALWPFASVTTTLHATGLPPTGVPESRPPELNERPASGQLGGSKAQE